MNFKDVYGFFIRCWSCGQTYVFGRFTGIISLVLLVSTYLAVGEVKLEYFHLIGLGLLMVVLILFSGFIYVKLGLYKSEMKYMYKENPEIQEIKKDVKRCLDLLETRK
jgi:hypothetical protein